MIKAALAIAILCATMLVGNAQAKDKDPPPPPPCNLITSWGCIGSVWGAKAAPSPVKSVTPSIPIPPPVRSR